MTRKLVPWFDLVVAIGAVGAGFALLASGAASHGPLHFLGWRTFAMGTIGALLTRPGPAAWRDGAAPAASLVAAIGLLGFGLTVGDAARVAVVVGVTAFGTAPLVVAGLARRSPSTTTVAGAALAAGAVALLGTVQGAGPSMALAAGSGVAFGVAVALMQRRLDGGPVGGLVTSALVLAGAALVVAGGVLGEGWLPAPSAIPLLVVTALGTGIAALLARWRAAEVLGVRTVRMALAAEAPVAVVTAVAVGLSPQGRDLWAAVAVGAVAGVVTGWDGSAAGAEAVSGGR